METILYPLDIIHVYVQIQIQNMETTPRQSGDRAFAVYLGGRGFKSQLDDTNYNNMGLGI